MEFVFIFTRDAFPLYFLTFVDASCAGTICDLCPAKLVSSLRCFPTFHCVKHLFIQVLRTTFPPVPFTFTWLPSETRHSSHFYNLGTLSTLRYGGSYTCNLHIRNAYKTHHRLKSWLGSINKRNSQRFNPIDFSTHQKLGLNELGEFHLHLGP